MKRIITLHILLLLVTITMAQEPELIGQLDSIIHYSYNDNTGTLDFESKSEFLYGQNKNPETPIVKVKYSWNNNQQSWVADSGFTYEYDKNGNQITCDARFFDTSKPAHLAWTLTMKKEYEYDENANKTLAVQYSWDHNTYSWMQTLKQAYFYTVDFKDSLSKTFLWDQAREVWLNYQKSEPDYDSLGNKVLATNYEWLEDRAIWTASSKNEYACDENGNTIAQLIYKQDEGNEEMNLYMIKEYEYDLSNSKVWDPYILGHQNRLLAINTMLSNGKGEMVLASADSLYYSQVESTSSAMEALPVSGMKIYPNPASDHITVQTENSTQAQFHIYDLFGRQMLSGNLTSPVIDVSNLKRGTYLLKLMNGNSIQLLRFVKK
jgi:hypothetical protein